MKKVKILPIVLYSLLGLVLVAFIVFAFGSAYRVSFAVTFERNIIRQLSWPNFDLFSVSMWGSVITCAVMVILLVFFDEREYHRYLRDK